MNPHSIYESHCALAVTGQLATQDTAELLAHAAQCATCRTHLLQLDLVHHTLLLHAVDQHHQPAMPPGALVRFRDRAIAEHIPLRSPQQRSSTLLIAPALATMMVFAIFLAFPAGKTSGPSAGPIAASNMPSDITHPHAANSISVAAQSQPVHHPHPAHNPVPARLSDRLQTQQADLAPERFKQTVLPLTPLFAPASSSAPPAVFPSLSADQIRRLDYFLHDDRAPGPSTVGLAALHLPEAFTLPDRTFDATSALQRLRFNLPANQ